MNPSRLGLNAHWPTPAQLDRLVAMGIQWIRIDANMKDVRPTPDKWDWAILEVLIPGLRDDELDFLLSSERCERCGHLEVFHYIGPDFTQCDIPDCRCRRG